MYRRIKADRIFDGEEMLQGKLLLVSENGSVESIIADDGNEAEHHQGILCPGFINSHCHLELSHLKNKVPPGEGMVQFLIDVVYARRNSEEGKMQPIENAEKEMWRGGIQGVADICNTTDTLQLKKKSRLHWHNLIEVINFYDAALDKQLQGFLSVLGEFEKAGMNAALTPHAPYSVSAATYSAINERTKEKTVSIHNQESKAENDLFCNGDGDFLRLYAEFGDGRSPFAVTGRSSLRAWLPHFTNGQTILLVHNNFTSEEDLHFAEAHAAKYGLQLVFCLCPNANLYIEGRMPPVEMLMRNHCRIVTGTDSYSSNYQLSIAEEIKTIRKHFPSIETGTLLKWSTSNGADALGWNDLGRFRKGTKPGVILLDEGTFAVTRLI